MANQQSQLYGQASAQSDSPSWPASGAGFGASGFDFGLSQPSTGFGPGLLGDTQTLSQNQGCADCQAGEPCEGCGSPSSPDNSGNGTIIKTQFPIPVPGLLPPLLPPQAQNPSGAPTAGDPNAWWNKGDADVSDWLRGVFEARRPPSKAVELTCESQLATDRKECEAIARRATAEAGPERGARELDSCNKHSMTRYGECLTNNGRPKSPPYPDWYEDED